MLNNFTNVLHVLSCGFKIFTFTHADEVIIMRLKFPEQLSIGQIKIDDLDLEISSRDDIPALLSGLRDIFLNIELRNKILDIIDKHIGVDKNNGRPGMSLWEIFVLGTLRLGLNADYDRIHIRAKKYVDVVSMLGHSMDLFEGYSLQAIKDNIRLFDDGLLNKINVELVKYGQSMLHGNSEYKIEARCDSFVVETDVHFPTDIGLLQDAMEVVLRSVHAWCLLFGLTSSRQYNHVFNKIKKLVRKAQNSKFRKDAKNGTDAAKNTRALEKAREAYSECINECINCLIKQTQILRQPVAEQTPDIAGKAFKLFEEICKFGGYALHQIDLIKRRVIQGEVIPHDEKIHSLFEEYTEWVSKGKAGVPVELGLRVCIVEDQDGFILHSRVMVKETDDKVAIPVTKELIKNFTSVDSISFDKGFHSKNNQEKLAELVNNVVMPIKGKPSAERKEIENSPDFQKKRRMHSSVESAINALEVHGLDRCLDHGLDGFKRYVGFAVVARNILKIGTIVLRKERQKLKRNKKHRFLACPQKQAA